jgi:hypothetical protein
MRLHSIQKGVLMAPDIYFVSVDVALATICNNKEG